MVLKPLFNPYASAFTTTYKPRKIIFNSDTKAFVPWHRALLGIHVTSVILVIFILTILVLLGNPRKQYGMQLVEFQNI